MLSLSKQRPIFSSDLESAMASLMARHHQVTRDRKDQMALVQLVTQAKVQKDLIQVLHSQRKVAPPTSWSTGRNSESIDRRNKMETSN